MLVIAIQGLFVFREKNSENHFIMKPDFNDENQAQIVVIGPLDYEKTSMFNLTIRAKVFLFTCYKLSRAK